ncbi:MAG: twin-arginine translocase TatA/TatE family subunit [Gemmatimonadota bacterium]
MGNLGMWEILLILFVLLLLFGAKRLPEIGRSLGRGIREFKGSLTQVEEEIKEIESGDESSASSQSTKKKDETTT